MGPLTYYVDAETYRLRRMVAPAQMGDGPPSDSAAFPSVTIDFQDYRTTDGLTLPWRTVMRVDLTAMMSLEERREVEVARVQMEQLDADRVGALPDTMAQEMRQLQLMLLGAPIVTEIRQVSVNAPLTNGIFEAPYDE